MLITLAQMSHGIYDLSTKQFVRKKMRMWSVERVCDSQKANYDEKENFHEKKTPKSKWISHKGNIFTCKHSL